jgi:bacterioferritin B
LAAPIAPAIGAAYIFSVSVSVSFLNSKSMLISKPMNAAMNDQVGNELAASNQYLAIAVYFDEEGLPTLAKHFFKQSAEERGHALRFVKYIVEMNGSVRIPEIPAPKAVFKSAEEAVRLSYDNEVTVTKQINEIVKLSIEEGDHLSKNFLDWFLAEQREEMSSMDTLLRMVKRAGESGLFFVENYLMQTGALSDAPEGGEEAGEA